MAFVGGSWVIKYKLWLLKRVLRVCVVSKWDIAILKLWSEGAAREIRKRNNQGDVITKIKR